LTSNKPEVVYPSGSVAEKLSDKPDLSLPDFFKDISIMIKPEENLALIMKDGKIYKNTIN